MQRDHMTCEIQRTVTEDALTVSTDRKSPAQLREYKHIMPLPSKELPDNIVKVTIKHSLNEGASVYALAQYSQVARSWRKAVNQLLKDIIMNQRQSSSCHHVVSNVGPSIIMDDLLSSLIGMSDICSNLDCLQMLDEFETVGLYRLSSSHRRVCVNCYETHTSAAADMQDTRKHHEHNHVISMLVDRDVGLGDEDFKRVDKLLTFMNVEEILQYYGRVNARRAEVESKLETLRNGSNWVGDGKKVNVGRYIKWGEGGYLIER
ncbi:hypothetical protein SeLEV6574_g04114 [Synchytrium endobioticum]|nr:hypothetical protein SeLEV6574_g04114 [Synchytrium endobioticum]